jgi:hypothetical protein
MADIWAVFGLARIWLLFLLESIKSCYEGEEILGVHIVRRRPFMLNFMSDE